METIKKIFKSPILETTLSKIILGIGICVFIFAIFLAGEEVGFRRAQFSYHFGENYSRIFGERGRMKGEFWPFENDIFPNIHGAVGKIISINLPSIVIADQNGIEKIITITNDSIMRRFRDIATSSDLKVGDVVTVLGSPNENGWIVAKLIRILPSLNTATTTTTKNI